MPPLVAPGAPANPAMAAGHQQPYRGCAASLYGEIMGSRREIGRPMSVVDGQIAAVARARRCQLATRNVTDFEACGLELIDPWAYESANETQSSKAPVRATPCH